MKYKNANEILPSDLVEEIQKYYQGGFLYIPKKISKLTKQLQNTVLSLQSVMQEFTHCTLRV